MRGLNEIEVDVQHESGNVPLILNEVRHALVRLLEKGEPHAIDLRRIPLASGEEQRIEQALGRGEVEAQLQALGPSIVVETAYSGAWLVTHYNEQNEIIARCIEIARIPEILQAQAQDIASGIAALEARLQETREERDPLK